MNLAIEVVVVVVGCSIDTMLLVFYLCTMHVRVYAFIHTGSLGEACFLYKKLVYITMDYVPTSTRFVTTVPFEIL